jgi:hypothetical protein
MSTPKVPAKSLITSSGTTPAISWMSFEVMADGGFVDVESREAD